MHQTPSIPDLLRSTARRFGRSPAVLFPDNNIRFAELDSASDAVAARLQREGIVKGDRVALYCINSAEFAIAYCGIVKAGAVVVPLNLLYSPQELRYVLQDSGARGVFCFHTLQEPLDRACADLEGVEFRVVVGGEGDQFADWSRFEHAPDCPQFDVAEDLAAILYTSGTTGRPKGAMLTHRNLVSNTFSVMQALRFRPGEDRLLVVLPMFHSFAATVGTLTPLLHGLSLAPVAKFDPAEVSRVIEAVGATVFLGVPSMYSLLLRLGDEEVRQWHSVRFCVSGGAAMPVEVMRQFEERYRISIYEGDGPTECSPVTCVNPVGGLTKAASVGLAVPDVEIEIFDEQGGQLPVDQIGEICVRGPNVMKGYWNQPEETDAAFFGEWVRTGDLGYKDADGYLFIVDRKKDMVIVNGMNVYPRMVEEVLYQHPDIGEAAVVGEPDQRHGEIVVAYVAAKPGAELTPAEVRAFCRERLGRHELPRKVLLREALPKNAAGKILKRELRRSGELERGVDHREVESD